MTKKLLVGGVLDWLVVEEKKMMRHRLIAHIGEIKVETLQNSPFFRAGQAGLLFVCQRKERKRAKGNTNRAFTSR